MLAIKPSKKKLVNPSYRLWMRVPVSPVSIRKALAPSVDYLDRYNHICSFSRYTLQFLDKKVNQLFKIHSYPSTAGQECGTNSSDSKECIIRTRWDKKQNTLKREYDLDVDSLSGLCCDVFLNIILATRGSDIITLVVCLTTLSGGSGACRGSCFTRGKN